MRVSDFNRRQFLQLAGAAGLTTTWPHQLKAVGDMIRRTIPKTGQTLPAVGLGTWGAFDVEAAGEEHRACLDLLLDAGGGMIDASPMYGRAESVVGELLSMQANRDSAFLATKVWTEGRDQGIAQMEESLRRLRGRSIDLMQVHNLIDWQTQIETLQLWKAAGIFRYIGVTHYARGAIDQLVSVMEREEIDFVQMAYSIGERAVEENLLPTAAERGIAVIVNRPFEGGELFSSVEGEDLPEWAVDADCDSWSQFFLKFVLSHPAVTCAIPATSNPAHMADNIAAGRGVLPDEPLRQRMVEFWEDV